MPGKKQRRADSGYRRENCANSSTERATNAGAVCCV
jgi:hypothetical protein